MNIKEVEAKTGITKQNIRFYEREGLLCPRRNPENDYREYGEEEIRRLKQIRIFRKLGMPLDEIRRVFDGAVSVQTALVRQKDALEKEKQDLDAAIRLCGEWQALSLEEMDADRCLRQIEEEEARGCRFADLLEDYRKVARGEYKKSFRFMPDSMCETPREFTEELLKYARENNQDITITKEGMMPEFTLDGVEYSALRLTGRYGMVVCCDMVHPELAEPDDVPEERKKVMKVITHVLPVLVVFALSFLMSAHMLYEESIEVALLMAIGETAVVCGCGFLYWRTKG